MYTNIKATFFSLLFCLSHHVVVAGGLVFPADTSFFSFKNKPVIYLTLDRTSSFVGGKSAATNEIKLGLEFKNKLRLGVGYGRLVSDIVVSKNIVTEPTGNDSTVNAQLFASFFSVNSEYIFYDSKRWQIAMPVGVNFGSSYFSFFQKTGDSFQERKIDKNGVVMIGASGIATFRLFRWVGLSGGLGYRVALVSNSNVKESFNSFVYVFKVRVFVGEIYKTVFPRGISGKQDPPYTNEYWD